MTRNLILAGGGGHALSLGTLLEDAGFCILGYTDLRATTLRWKYLGTDDEIVAATLPENTQVVVAVGTNTRIRGKIYNEYLSSPLQFLTFKHPQSYVSVSAKLEEGSVIYPNTFIGADVVLGQNVHLCAGAIVDHGTIIGAHSYVAPGAVIAGNVAVGTNCMLGINSTVMESIRLADYTQLGAASFLLRSVDTPSQIYAGVPAVCLKGQ
jgi:sugar O-acyltransferase (sialic acid O-acetyltransferase NeuD family)